METQADFSPLNSSNTPIHDGAENLSQFLKLELERRISQNPRYSLRSFSRFLNLSSSFVSKLLNGKRPITDETLLKIASALSMDPRVLRLIQTKAKAPGAGKMDENKTVSTLSSPVQQKLVMSDYQKRIQSAEYRRITLDQFQFISEWYHFAILELIHVADFRYNLNFIASRLNISPFLAKEALDRLIRLGLVTVKKNKTGREMLKINSEHNTTIGPEIVTGATLKQQQSFLKFAQDALTNTPISQRSQTSMTMSCPSDRIHEAKELIRDFQRRFTTLMQSPGRRDSVYQLSISFFPLVTPIKTNSKVTKRNNKQEN